MRKLKLLLVVSFLVLIVASTLNADVKLAKIFSDHMMIQRDKPIKVWGLATPNSKVKITIAGKEVEVLVTDFPFQPSFGPIVRLTVTKR